MSVVQEIAAALLLVFSLPLIVAGVFELALLPVAIWGQFRRRRPAVFETPTPFVSVIVPAYNEGKVIENCIRSIVADGYRQKEVIVVDDGSTDDTYARMRTLAETLPLVIITKENGGKASALNAGIAASRGEILCMVDADGMFGDDTIEKLLRGFENQNVGGVCGNDRPVNLDRVQTRLLALLTHNTALIRRALARIGCLTIVSGNSGAFRRSVIEQLGGYHEGTIGEDLELTWRVRLAGYRIEFCPDAMVRAEVPSSIKNLWKQRVRWTRGLVQTAWRHRSRIGRRGAGRVGPYLAYNVASMLIFPVLQILSLFLIVFLLVSGESPLGNDATAVALWLGLVNSAAVTFLGVALDRSWRDLRYLVTAPMWIAFSVFTSLVTVVGLRHEAVRRPLAWNKFERTGVVTVRRGE